MARWFKRDTTAHASVLFRGSLQPRPEEFASLARKGIEVTPGTAPPTARWALQLRHPTWGEAELIAFKDLPLPPREMIDYTAGLTDRDRDDFAAAGSGLIVTAPAKTGTVLRDRKALLYFGRAVMGNEGIGLVDHLSLLMWSRDALDDELLHDANLDINQVHCVHAVAEDESGEHQRRASWVHTHGLGELGGFDFDILRPSTAFMDECTDVLRAIAFAVVEGRVKPDTERFEVASGCEIRFVEAGEFQKRANLDDAALREHDEDHSRNRAVLCEPEKQRPFGGVPRRPRSATFFRRDNYDGLLIHFSDEATALMEARARATVALLGDFLAEFRDLRLPTLVKLGLPTASGGREHPWFSVNSISGDKIDCTCENEPFDVPDLKRGDRRVASIEDLTDWLIMTPVGSITPSSLRTARTVREHREEIKRIVDESGL